MSNLIRHVILKDNVVVNVIEYETEQTGCPEGLENVIALASDEGQIGWLYANNTFTDPNPPVAPEPLPELTPQEKLANAGLSVDDLKSLLGIK
jgi:hypothetical protein